MSTDLESAKFKYSKKYQLDIFGQAELFKGDAIASQLEAGHQKGGYVPCWHCPVKMTRGRDLAYVLNGEQQTMKRERKATKFLYNFSLSFGENAIKLETFKIRGKSYKVVRNRRK